MIFDIVANYDNIIFNEFDKTILDLYRNSGFEFPGSVNITSNDDFTIMKIEAIKKLKCIMDEYMNCIYNEFSKMVGFNCIFTREAHITYYIDRVLKVKIIGLCNE